MFDLKLYFVNGFRLDVNLLIYLKAITMSSNYFGHDPVPVLLIYFGRFGFLESLDLTFSLLCPLF